jgi:hypothetical protein
VLALSRCWRVQDTREAGRCLVSPLNLHYCRGLQVVFAVQEQTLAVLAAGCRPVEQRATCDTPQAARAAQGGSGSTSSSVGHAPRHVQRLSSRSCLSVCALWRCPRTSGQPTAGICLSARWQCQVVPLSTAVRRVAHEGADAPTGTGSAIRTMRSRTAGRIWLR